MRVRNYRFATGPDVPRHWHPSGRAISRFYDNLSVFFPIGERFFMTSVQAFRDVAPDPRAIRDFCAQEGIHGREHERYNEMLRAQGIDVAKMEANVDWILETATRLAPERWLLAATAALEHFTALLGHEILERSELLEGADATMAALWRWHAAEENEHKHVAYDVYLAAGGTYPERTFVMVIAAIIFWTKVVEQQARFMHHDGDLFSIEEHVRLQRFLWAEPGALPPMWRRWLAWFRPGFHPNENDEREVLAAWESAATNMP
jgi:predicted metal-dependent hydrolase